jgi:hypothetical protein
MEFVWIVRAFTAQVLILQGRAASYITPDRITEHVFAGGAKPVRTAGAVVCRGSERAQYARFSRPTLSAHTDGACAKGLLAGCAALADVAFDDLAISGITACRIRSPTRCHEYTAVAR